MSEAESVDFLIVGAGITGLAFANAIRSEKQSESRLLILEAEDEPGGYCRTVTQDGFTWDYSGHFFHFRHPEIEKWLTARMPGEDIRTVTKRSLIRFGDLDIDFPFQKNIHQLSREDFVDCLVSLFFRSEENPAEDRSFAGMLYRKFGRGIADRFLIPYNEKLYACSLASLDANAMGRFFPDADIADIIRNMRSADNASYNQTFTYPRGGAVQYVRALLRDLPPSCLSLSEPVLAIDVDNQVATTSRRTIRYQHLVSSAPLPRLVEMTSFPTDSSLLTANKVLVFNLGFDRKGPRGVHWIYFPERKFCFYRVGFYDNIMDDERMSLYVEIGASSDAVIDVAEMRARVLQDLEGAGIVTGHQLLSAHSIVLDPAYVHITTEGQAEVNRARQGLAKKNVHSIGRYGGWTYCSIEDNIVEARALSSQLASG